jgi:hypothetical protein
LSFRRMGRCCRLSNRVKLGRGNAAVIGGLKPIPHRFQRSGFTRSVVFSPACASGARACSGASVPQCVTLMCRDWLDGLLLRLRIRVR